MKRNKTVVAVCALLFVIVFASAACSTHNDGTREQDAAPSSEPPVVVETPTGTPSASSTPDQAPEHVGSTQPPGCGSSTPGEDEAPDDGRSPGGIGGNITNDVPDPPPATPSATQPEHAPSSTPTPAPEHTPLPTNPPAPPPAPEPEPEPVLPEPPSTQTRTICNTCGADITGNVPAHGDGHLLNGEDFSYRVE